MIETEGVEDGHVVHLAETEQYCLRLRSRLEFHSVCLQTMLCWIGNEYWKAVGC